MKFLPKFIPNKYGVQVEESYIGEVLDSYWINFRIDNRTVWSLDLFNTGLHLHQKEGYKVEAIKSNYAQTVLERLER